MDIKTFKALGEPTRMKIIRLLAEQELCVCDLEEIMDMSQPRISQHLKVLKEAGLVTERRESQRRICSLDNEAIENAYIEFKRFLNSPLRDLKEFQDEYQRLQALDGLACERRHPK